MASSAADDPRVFDAPPATAMIVEDEVVIAQDLERRLASMGLDVVAIAHSADGAFRAARLTNPTLVLMDIGLGGDDGLTTAEKLQREGDCAVMFVTGYADSETLARVGGLTSAVYVSKPFSDPVLRASVRLALFRHYAEKERRRVEQERSIAEARLRAVLDHTVDGVLSLDHEQRIVVFSRGAQLQFGYTESEVLGHPIDLLLAPSEQLRATRVGRLLVGDGRTSAHLVREMGRKKDGTTFPLEISVSHLPNSLEQPSILCVRDTTERDRLEARLKLVEQLQIVGSLSASMTHEFNNVLTAVESNAFMLGTYLPPEGRQYLDALAGAVDRGRALSRQLLRLNSTGSAQDVSISVDVNESIQSLQRLLQRTLRKNVQVELQLGADAGLVLAHEYAIEHVVLNLVHNARDAMPVGGKITITTGSLEVRAVEQFQALEPGHYGTVAVADQGEGISATIASRLFEPFITTKAPGAGLGLGLHISRAIARRSGGDLWVGARDVGTVFTLALKRPPKGTSQSSMGSQL